MTTRLGDLKHQLPELCREPFTWYLTGALMAVGDQQGPTFVLPATGPDFKAHSLVVSFETAPSGSDFVLDIRDDGVSIFGGSPATITDGDLDTEILVFDGSPQVIAAGSKIVLDIDQIGSVVPGAYMTATLYLEPVPRRG